MKYYKTISFYLLVLLNLDGKSLILKDIVKESKKTISLWHRFSVKF